jgi:hypothetical protein
VLQGTQATVCSVSLVVHCFFLDKPLTECLHDNTFKNNCPTQVLPYLDALAEWLGNKMNIPTIFQRTEIPELNILSKAELYFPYSRPI